MKYRRKPTEVEAIQYTGKNFDEVLAFTDGQAIQKPRSRDVVLVTDDWNVTLYAGNWIVKQEDCLIEVCYEDDFKERFEVMG